MNHMTYAHDDDAPPLSWNQRLAQADAKRRCGFCKRELVAGAKTFANFGDSRLFCSDGCREDGTVNR